MRALGNPLLHVQTPTDTLCFTFQPMLMTKRWPLLQKQNKLLLCQALLLSSLSLLISTSLFWQLSDEDLRPPPPPPYVLFNTWPNSWESDKQQVCGVVGGYKVSPTLGAHELAASDGSNLQHAGGFINSPPASKSGAPCVCIQTRMPRRNCIWKY